MTPKYAVKYAEKCAKYAEKWKKCGNKMSRVTWINFIFIEVHVLPKNSS